MFSFQQEREAKARETWLKDAVTALTPPQTLTERNWVQLMLADRFSVQFRVQKLEALEQVAKVYGTHFNQES